MLPKYSALGKKETPPPHHYLHHKSRLYDLTRPLVGHAASFLTGKPNQTSVASARRSGGRQSRRRRLFQREEGLGPQAWHSRKLFPSINCRGAARDGALSQRRTSTGSQFPGRERGWAPSGAEGAGSSADADLGWFWQSIWYRLSISLPDRRNPLTIPYAETREL